MKSDTQSENLKIRQFIIDNFLYGRSDGLSDQDSFLESGLIDSTGMLELITFIEQEYGIEVQDEELIPDNLDSIDRVVAFIQQKRVHYAGNCRPV